MRTHTIRRHALVTTAAALLCLGACGDDDSDETNDVDSGVGTNASGSGGATSAGDGSQTGGGRGGDDATGGTNAGTTAGRGGSGSAGSSGRGGNGAGGSGGDGAMPGLMCTEDPPDAPVTCGGVACPMPMGANRCLFPCCVSEDGEQSCGTRSTAMGFASDCAAPPIADDRCPGVESQGRTLVGCCTADNLCGIISTLSNTCITESRFVTLPEDPQRCDSIGEPGEDDAGMEGTQDDAGSE
jgi:hypothetical protein